MKLYIKYSKEYPYLPEAVAESKKELAELLRITPNNVRSSMCHKTSTYAEVEIEDK